MPTGRICAVVTEVPTYLMEKYARHIGVPRAEYRGPETPGRVRTGESREGTHAHFVFQVYISPAPKPSKWRIGPQYEKCIWNLVYRLDYISSVYTHARWTSKRGPRRSRYNSTVWGPRLWLILSHDSFELTQIFEWQAVINSAKFIHQNLLLWSKPSLIQRT